MEELKNVSSAPQAVPQDARKPYTPPTADIILLVPKEELSAWDYGKYDGENRWALTGWNSFNHSAASGGMEGTVYNPSVNEGNSWTLTK